MAQYKADVWLGSKSGRQTVSVAASSLPGAVEQSRPAAPDERSEPPGQSMQTVRPDGTQQPLPPLQKQGAP